MRRYPREIFAAQGLAAEDMASDGLAGYKSPSLTFIEARSWALDISAEEVDASETKS